jgi:hypothetical protein
VYFFALFAVLGIAAIGFFLRERTKVLGQALMAAGCLGCAALVGWQVYQSLFSGSEISRDRYHAVAAYAMGHQVVRELAGRQGKVCLIFPPESASSAEALDTLFNTFARVLNPFAALEVTEATLRVKPKLIRSGQIPLSAFEQAFVEITNAVAYVSFAGISPDAEKLSVFARKDAPAVFVYDSSGGTNWVGVLKKKLIRAVIVPRRDVKVRAKEKIVGPPEEIFKEFFHLATPETAEEVGNQSAHR